MIFRIRFALYAVSVPPLVKWLFHGRSLTAKKTNFIAKNVIPGLPDVGKIPPDIFEHLEML